MSLKTYLECSKLIKKKFDQSNNWIKKYKQVALIIIILVLEVSWK